jgi:hypothetical protein
MLDARWWDDPSLINAPLFVRLLIVAMVFASLYFTGRPVESKFNLRAFIAWTVGGTAAVWLFFSIF